MWQKVVLCSLFPIPSTCVQQMTKPLLWHSRYPAWNRNTWDWDLHNLHPQGGTAAALLLSAFCPPTPASLDHNSQWLFFVLLSSDTCLSPTTHLKQETRQIQTVLQQFLSCSCMIRTGVVAEVRDWDDPFRHMHWPQQTLPMRGCREPGKRWEFYQTCCCYPVSGSWRRGCGGRVGTCDKLPGFIWLPRNV